MAILSPARICELCQEGTGLAGNASGHIERSTTNLSGDGNLNRAGGDPHEAMCLYTFVQQMKPVGRINHEWPWKAQRQANRNQ